jgi:hypothetical protein
MDVIEKIGPVLTEGKAILDLRRWCFPSVSYDTASKEKRMK